MSSVKQGTFWIVARVQRLIDEYIDGRLGGVSRVVFVFVFLLWTLIQVFRSAVKDRCLQVASSLAYKTILALVPLLAVGFALMKAFGAFTVDPVTGQSAVSALVQFVSENFIPVQGPIIAGHLQAFAERISVGTLGAIGVGVLLFMAIFLFLDIEKVYNDIFRTETKRSLFTRFTKFYAIVTLGPALAALSLYQTAQHFGSSALLKFVLPTLTTFAALALSYKLMPDTRVRWPAAAIGGLVAAVLFEVAKIGFRLYVTGVALKNATALYGALALFPLFLVWIWLTWLIVLIGAELTHTAQNIHGLTEKERGRRAGAGTAEALLRRITPRLAARTFLAIAERWARGGGPYPLEELRAALDMAEQEAAYLLKRFVEAKLVFATGDPGEDVAYLPARPLGAISIDEVARAPVGGDWPELAESSPRDGNGATAPGEGNGNGADADADAGATSPRDVLDRLLDQADRSRTQLLDRVTYAELVGEPGARGDARELPAAR